MLIEILGWLLEALAEGDVEFVTEIVGSLVDLDWTSGGGRGEKQREETFAAAERYKSLPKDFGR